MRNYITILKNGWDNYCMGCLHDGEEPSYVKFLFMYIQHYVQVLICRTKGHDLESDSYVNPDSGGEDVWCNRCNHNWGHIYY